MLLIDTCILMCYFIIIWCHANVSEKITYISMEHPHVEYYNPQYLKSLNLTTTRYGRKNPVYYVGLNYESLVTFDDNMNVDFYFFEWLSNQYKRSFVEMHFTWCSLVEKDPFFGAAMRQGKLAKPCPHPPDTYNLSNMTINPSIIPRGFPFTRGRIYANLTHAETKTRLADGHIDMKIEFINKDKAKNLFKN